MSVTTIAIDASAHRRLAHLKEEWRVDSLNDVVHRLLDSAQPIPKSMFGSSPGLARLTRKLRNEM